jgi:hypothetical protein
MKHDEASNIKHETRNIMKHETCSMKHETKNYFAKRRTKLESTYFLETNLSTYIVKDEGLFWN